MLICNRLREPLREREAATEIISHALTVAVPFPVQCVFAIVCRARDVALEGVHPNFSRTLTVAVSFPKIRGEAQFGESLSDLTRPIEW